MKVSIGDVVEYQFDEEQTDVVVAVSNSENNENFWYISADGKLRVTVNNTSNIVRKISNVFMDTKVDPS